MRQFIYTISTLCVLGSCDSTYKGGPVELRDQVLEAVEQLPDTILASPLNRERNFQLDLSQQSIDIDATSKLRGEWEAIQGDIGFLLTRLNVPDKVVFKDTINMAMTGWGMLVYNRSANFYFGEGGSYMYEYFTDQNGFLNIVQLQYRNEDLSFKTEPEPVIEKLRIEWLRENEIELSFENRSVKLKKLPLTNAMNQSHKNPRALVARKETLPDATFIALGYEKHH